MRTERPLGINSIVSSSPTLSSGNVIILRTFTLWLYPILEETIRGMIA